MGSLRARRLATLMDQVAQRGGLFLEWASAALREGDRRGSGELPEDNSSSAGRSTSSGEETSLPLLVRVGGNGREGSRDCMTQTAFNWVRRYSFSSRS